MAKLEYFTLQSFIKDKIADVTINKKATSIALGIAISRILPIPSTEVESSEANYSANVAATSAQMVSDFNESIVVDVDLVLETARTYWLIRYANTYPDINIPMISIGDFSFLTKLSGGARYLNNETNAFTEKYSELMVVLVNRITRVIKAKEEALA